MEKVLLVIPSSMQRLRGNCLRSDVYGAREAEFLQMLDHPNIVECKDVVENEKQMVIIMEWLRGGHLLDNLEEMAGQHYSEQQAAILFVQVTAQPTSLCLIGL